MNKNKKSAFSELLTQIIVMGILGVASLWILKNRAPLADLGPLSFLKLIPWLILGLYLWLLTIVIRSLSSSYFLKRYDPADARSLQELSRVRRYHIEGSAFQGDPSLVIRRLIRELKRTKGVEKARYEFGAVYERPATTPLQSVMGRGERWIFNYNPMLNVLIADRYMSDSSRFILRRNHDYFARRNVLLLISDMENDVEILSAGSGVVNFLPAISGKVILMPYLLDLRHGRLFYPSDLSSLSLPDQLYFKQQKKLILSCLGALPPERAAHNAQGGESRQPAPTVREKHDLPH